VGVALVPDGRIVAVGPSAGKFLAVRVSSYGRFDETFASDGMKKIDVGVGAYASSVRIADDGKVVIGGFASDDLAVVRLRPSGRPDGTFSANGMKRIDAGGVERGFSLALQPNGRIVVAGTSVIPDGDNDFILARLLP
jgi:uncharacterized delta-60 repeat protein